MRNILAMNEKDAYKKTRVRGQMKPLTVKQVSAIEMMLASNGDWRGLGMFRLGIDSMFRACDLVRICVDEVTALDGKIMEDPIIRQKKTGKSVRVTLSDTTRDALERWLTVRPSFWGEWLFTGEKRGTHLSESQYRREAKRWFAMIGLDVRFYSTHSLRRTKAALVYEKTGSVEVVRRLLGHASVSATSNYLGIDDADALKIAKEIKI